MVETGIPGSGPDCEIVAGTGRRVGRTPIIVALRDADLMRCGPISSWGLVTRVTADDRYIPYEDFTHLGADQQFTPGLAYRVHAELSRTCSGDPEVTDVRAVVSAADPGGEEMVAGRPFRIRAQVANFGVVRSDSLRLVLAIQSGESPWDSTIVEDVPFGPLQALVPGSPNANTVNITCRQEIRRKHGTTILHATVTRPDLGNITCSSLDRAVFVR